MLVEDQLSALICFSNAPGKDSVTAEQMHIFETVLSPHPGLYYGIWAHHQPV